MKGLENVSGRSAALRDGLRRKEEFISALFGTIPQPARAKLLSPGRESWVSIKEGQAPEVRHNQNDPPLARDAEVVAGNLLWYFPYRGARK